MLLGIISDLVVDLLFKDVWLNDFGIYWLDDLF